MARAGTFLVILAMGARGLQAEEVEGHPVFDWDLVSLEQNSQRFNGSVLSGFHNLRSPGTTPHRAFKTGLGLIYSQEDLVATGAGVEQTFSTQRLIMNPKINYGLYDALEGGLGLEANYVTGKEVQGVSGTGPIETSEENADLSAAVAGVKWSFPRWWQNLRLGAAFDTRLALNRHGFGMLPQSLFNFEVDGEYSVTNRFSLVGNLQFITSDSFKEISDEVIGDVGATYTFSDQFRGLVFGTLQEDDPAQAVIIFLGFAGQYLFERHSFALAVDFQVNDVRRDVRTEGQIDVEFSYTFTFR
jgi:hypothetical protein